MHRESRKVHTRNLGEMHRVAYSGKHGGTNRRRTETHRHGLRGTYGETQGECKRMHGETRKKIDEVPYSEYTV